jgi:hypothetical protein
LSQLFSSVSALVFFTHKGGDMQYLMTGVAVLIISGLALHLLSLALEGLYKTLFNRTTAR